MENTAYEITEWVNNNIGYLLAVAGVAASTALYLAIKFDPAKYREDALRRDSEKLLEGNLEKEVFKD